MRRPRGVDLTSPPLSSGLARRMAAPEVTASAGADGLAPYRCPWSWVVLGTGCRWVWGPGCHPSRWCRRERPGKARVEGNQGRPRGTITGCPLHTAYQGCSEPGSPQASLGTAGTAEGTAGTVAPNQKQRTFAQTQISASSPNFTLLNREPFCLLKTRLYAWFPACVRHDLKGSIALRI